jgi:hypothetical protein
VGDVKLPQSVVHADPSNKETLTLHGATVHHAGGIAGDQDEDLGSIGEHHRLKRKLRQDVVREVIEEDAEEGKNRGRNQAGDRAPQPKDNLRRPSDNSGRTLRGSSKHLRQAC